jgi:hypothetical protein
LTSASFSCGDVPCTGGSVYPATGGTVYQNRTRYYTSGSYTADTPSVTASVSISQTAFTGSNLGKTDTDRTSLGNTTATWTSNGKSDSKTITVYQQANTHSDSWNNPSVSLTESPGTQITNAAQRVTVTASATQSGTRTWCTNQSSPISNSSFSWNWSQDGTASYCTATTSNNVNYVDFSANGGAQSRTSPVYTATATGAGSKTGSYSVFITQSGEDKPSPSVNDVGISFSTFPPPTPTVYTTFKNTSSKYGLYGNWGSVVPSDQTISGDFAAGTSRQVILNNSAVTLTNFSGAVTAASTLDPKENRQVSITCSGGGGSGSMYGTSGSGGYIQLTGTIIVKDGSTVTISIT